MLASLSKKSLTLPGLASDWEIDPDELEIDRRASGAEWELGSGASAKARTCFDAIFCPQPTCPAASLTLCPQGHVCGHG